MSEEHNPYVSIVFSFRNEEDVLEELLDRLHSVLDPTGVDYEFIFVNDASTDRSLQILTERAKDDPCIRVINMSSRFGVNPCFLAGMRHATGDAVITMDTDLQDPPEMIPGLILEWEKGMDVVHTTRTGREGESVVKTRLTRLAYYILDKMSDVHVPMDTGMFKLMSRRVVDTIAAMEETDAFLRGLITWVGFNQTQVFYKREERFAGVAHFSWTGKDPWLVFARGLLSFSRMPLVILLALGTLITVPAFLRLGVMLLGGLFGAEYYAGRFDYTLLVFIGGVQIIGIATVGFYVSRTYNQVKKRPEYIIESTSGFSEDG